MKNVRISPVETLVYPITDGTATIENFAEKSARILRLVRTASDSSISLVQIREKKLPARLVFELAREAVRVAGSKTKILVNDRADIALAAGAAGVHLTAKSIPVAVVRENFPKNFIIGFSAHSLEDAESARDGGADFVVYSPIFATPSKEAYGAPHGLEKLRAACERLKPFPVVALGGVNENNYESVLEKGARGFAAIRFLNDANALPKIAEAIKSYDERRK